MAVLSDKTSKNGLLQRFEFWARLKDGTLDHASPNTLTYQVVDRINVAFDKIMPILLQFNDQVRWDDVNHTNAPIGYIDLEANVNQYKITQDSGGLEILNLVSVGVKRASTDTAFETLERIDLNDDRVPQILEPDTSLTGKPSAYVETLPFIYTDILSDTSITNGIVLMFQREQSRFDPTDLANATTYNKSAGIPVIFDELLVLHAVHDYIAVNRTADQPLLQVIRAEIRDQEKDLKRMIDARNPSRMQMTIKTKNFR